MFRAPGDCLAVPVVLARLPVPSVHLFLLGFQTVVCCVPGTWFDGARFAHFLECGLLLPSSDVDKSAMCVCVLLCVSLYVACMCRIVTW